MREQRLEKLFAMHAENPADSFVLYAIGMEYLGVNQPDEAIRYFEMCLKEDPKNISTFYQLGLLYNSLGQEEKALGFLEQGISLLDSVKDRKTFLEFKSLMEEISF